MLLIIAFLEWSEFLFAKNMISRWWWHTPFINPSTWRQRLADFCELEDSLVHRVSFRTANTTQRDSVLKDKTKNTVHFCTDANVYRITLKKECSLVFKNSFIIRHESFLSLNIYNIYVCIYIYIIYIHVYNQV